ncbi:hypothetical protein [Oryza sativa Japonica Group]|uniref:Uncharacterized protein n=1 Tax=Oryza sativa subsp. japonica TaxID=39947 RepID=Q5JJT1_ORYSJ|nr:hypothetical protein [Oryza sativa Japonica Group]
MIEPGSTVRFRYQLMIDDGEKINSRVVQKEQSIFRSKRGTLHDTGEPYCGLYPTTTWQQPRPFIIVLTSAITEE